MWNNSEVIYSYGNFHMFVIDNKWQQIPKECEICVWISVQILFCATSKCFSNEKLFRCMNLLQRSLHFRLLLIKIDYDYIHRANICVRSFWCLQCTYVFSILYTRYAVWTLKSVHFLLCLHILLTIPSKSTDKNWKEN